MGEVEGLMYPCCKVSEIAMAFFQFAHGLVFCVNKQVKRWLWVGKWHSQKVFSTRISIIFNEAGRPLRPNTGAALLRHGRDLLSSILSLSRWKYFTKYLEPHATGNNQAAIHSDAALTFHENGGEAHHCRAKVPFPDLT